jgi:hypothetical protein
MISGAGLNHFSDDLNKRGNPVPILLRVTKLHGSNIEGLSIIRDIGQYRDVSMTRKMKTGFFNNSPTGKCNLGITYHGSAAVYPLQVLAGMIVNAGKDVFEGDTLTMRC